MIVMRSIVLVFSILLFVGCGSDTSKSTQSDVFHLKGQLSVEKLCDMEWICRYEDSDIKVIKERAAVEPSECDVMFFGSSSIRRWESLAQDMAPLKVVNRGYGGATLRDLHYNYKTVMAHYKPKAFVFYCDNDLRTKPEVNITVGELFDLCRLLFDRIDKDYPGVPIYFLAMKHCKHREAIRDRQAMFNGLMKEYASVSDQLIFVDTCTALLTEDGAIDTTLFVDDNLHLNGDGYIRWRELLRPLLIK